MTTAHRTVAIGAIAAAALAASSVPLSAHTAVATRDCDGITIYAGRFMPGPNPARAVVAIDGENVTGYDVTLDNKVPARIPLLLAPGNHFISVSLAWSLADNVQPLYLAGQGVVTCPELPAAPVEEPPVVEQPAPEQPAPQSDVEVTTPWVRVSLPRFKCPRLLPSRAWQRIIWGRHRVMCPLRHPRAPRSIAVLAERR